MAHVCVLYSNQFKKGFKWNDPEIPKREKAAAQHDKNKRAVLDNTCTLQIYTMEEPVGIIDESGFTVGEQYKMDAYSFEKDESGYSIMTVARKV